MPQELTEIVKHLGRPIDTACELIEKILSVPAKKFGDLLGDQVSYWQWSNRLRIAELAVAKLKERGYKIRQLPLDFSVPFLRDCGDAENPDLREWWAELLTSSIGEESSCHVAFVNTLRNMSSTDVRFLDTLITIGHVDKDGRIEAVATSCGLSLEQAKVSFHNLERLGFFTPTGRRLKGFGFDFLGACYPHKERIASYQEKQSQIKTVVVTD